MSKTCVAASCSSVWLHVCGGEENCKVLTGHWADERYMNAAHLHNEAIS